MLTLVYCGAIALVVVGAICMPILYCLMEDIILDRKLASRQVSLHQICQALIRKNNMKKTRSKFIKIFNFRSTFLIADIDIARTVLKDVDTYCRWKTLISFAETFSMDNIFTTSNKRIQNKLHSLLSKQASAIDPQQLSEKVRQYFKQDFHPFLATNRNVHTVPVIEGMTLRLISSLFLNVSHLSTHDSEIICTLIKQLWQIKSKRNNILWERYNKASTEELRSKKVQLIQLLDKVKSDNSGSLSDKNGPWQLTLAQYADEDALIPGRSDSLLNLYIPLFETLARTLLCALYELSLSEELQNTICREYEEDPSYRRDSMVNCVWQETLRLYPPTANMTRIVNARNKEGLPIGARVIVDIPVFHQDEHVWSDPYSFNPQRWVSAATESSAKRNYFMPWSLGPSACAGINYASTVGQIFLSECVAKWKWQTHNCKERPLPVDLQYNRGPDINLELAYTARDR